MTKLFNKPIPSADTPCTLEQQPKQGLHVLTKWLKKLAMLVLLMICSNMAFADEGTKIVGGDLSLVPAYVTAGDSWLKADGTSITTTAQMLDYVKGLGWNSVRVRLFVDPSQDSNAATCQDIDYVKTLGAAIKSAGLNFLLDIHYSDTWADPSNQKIPTSWNITTNMDIADKVYSYTKEVLNTLKDASATPDFVQIGNEINGGMLWTTSDGKYPSSDYTTYGYCPYWTTRSTYAASWERLCRILHAGSKAVRELCPDAKIIVHNAMEKNTATDCLSKTYLQNFYTYITQSTDYPVYYDIIGLSYYPAWHGTLDYLGQTISALQTSLPTKEIQIVETGWYNSYFPTSGTTFDEDALGWTASALGQYNYLKALTSKINGSDYSHVTGLYYWQPEECGSGSTDHPVISSSWDNRGLWVNGSNGSHALQSATSSTTDMSSYFSNLDFESGNTGWTFSTGNGWSTNEIKEDSWAYTASYVSNAWENNGVSAGYILSQTASNIPAGTYTITAVVHTTNSGIYLNANNDQTEVGTVSSWKDAKEVTVTTTLESAGELTIGIYSDAQSTTGLSVYSDNFTVTKNAETVYPIKALTDFSGTYTDDFTDPQTIASESYIGTSDYLTGWWGAFSDTYTLGDKEQYHFNFINHNAGTDNVYNNWVLCAVNGSGHSTTDRSDYAEYFVLRNDNYELKSTTVLNGLTKGGSSYSITGDESNFITDMNGATVDMYVTYTKGTSIAVNATITATDGDVYIYTYIYDASSVTADNVYLFLTVDHSYIDLKTAELISTVEETIDGVTYTIDLTNSTASVTGTTSALPNDVVIPSSITYNSTSYSVTSIADNAFKSNTTVNSIHTSNSITSVGDNAFDGCTYLNYVCLGTGVTSIGGNAFNGCTSLNVLVLNNTSAITYGTTPFNGVDDDADETTTTVNTRIYLSSTEYDKLSTYTDFGFASDNICKTDIKNGIIYGLWGDNTASVAGYTDDLAAQIRIPSTLHYDTDYVPCTQYFMDQIEQYAFAKATVLTNVTVCNNTNEIGMCAFRNCKNLTTVTFGEDMTIFYDNVFYGDSKLTSFTLYANAAPTTWGNSTYTPVTGLSGITTLYCPYESANTAYSGFKDYSTLTVSTVALDQGETTNQPSSKLTADDATTTYSAQNITINRTLEKGNYYTLVLPWDLSAAEVTALGITPYYLNEGTWIEDGTLHIVFHETTTMQGGVPYIVYVSGESCTSGISLGLEFTNEYEGIEKPEKSTSTSTIASVDFIGSYIDKQVPDGSYFIKSNQLCKAAGEYVYIHGYRGYITTNASNPTKAFTNVVYDIDDEETGIVSLDAETLKPIEHEGIYDLSGRKLQSMPSARGIYVVNGKKVVVNQK